jgi:thiamine-monophosphate kinase
MDIKTFGGEFKLINEITKKFHNHHNVLKTIGDDAAVIKKGDEYEVITTDILVENDHFNCSWSSPYQIGRKTVEVNVSDVLAMGALPELLLLNLVLRNDLTVEFVQELYKGIQDCCDKYKITLIGGDTTHGDIMVIGATLTGRTKKPIMRSGAKTGDLICVTGEVGGSAAGFFSWRKGIKPGGYVLKRHLEPTCRYDLGPLIAKYATSMIDVSDGVASEVKHICEQSNVGALIEAKNIPIHPETNTTAEKIGLTGLACALSGGEDFELLFTIDADELEDLKKEVFDFKLIGNILEQEAGTNYIDLDNEQKPLPGGFDHFK